MDQDTIDAVKERLSLGYTKDKIVNELVDAGYPEDVATEVYAEVVDEKTPKAGVPTYHSPVEFTETNHSVVEQGVSFSDGGEVVTQPTVSPSGHRNLIIILISLFAVIFSGMVYGFAFGGFENMQKYFSSLGSSAPYETEGEMMISIINASRQMKAFSFNSDYEINLEPKAVDTPLYTNSEFDNLSEFEGGLPTEGNARLSLSGLVDTRDLENPELDIDINFNALMEPFIINLGGNVRMAEGNIYGKITDLPAMFKAQMPMEIPLDTWILLASAGEKKMFMDELPVLKQTLKPVESLFSGLSKTPLSYLMLVGKESILSGNNFAKSQAASGIQALSLQTSSLTDSQQKMIVFTITAIENNPPIKFVGSPKEIKKEGETVYEYEVDVDYDNLIVLINSLAQESSRLYGKTNEVDDLLKEIPSRESFEIFNKLVDLRYTFRKDGSTQGFSVKSVFVPGSEAMKAQINVRFETTFGHNNEAIDITVPDNIHPESLSDMFAEMQNQHQQDNYDMTVKMELSMMRTTAELIYNEKGYSYALVCSELKNNPTYSVASECSANDTEYVIYTALLYVPTYYCVDSTGVSREVLLPPDEGEYKCPAGLPEDTTEASSVSMEDANSDYKSEFVAP